MKRRRAASPLRSSPSLHRRSPSIQSSSFSSRGSRSRKLSISGPDLPSHRTGYRGRNVSRDVSPDFPKYRSPNNSRRNKDFAFPDHTPSRSCSRSPLPERRTSGGYHNKREDVGIRRRRTNDLPYAEEQRWRRGGNETLGRGRPGGPTHCSPPNNGLANNNNNEFPRGAPDHQYNHHFSPNYRRPSYNRPGSFGSSRPVSPVPFSPRFNNIGAPPYHPRLQRPPYNHPGQMNTMYKNRQPRIDRSTTCPFMLRIYVNANEHYSLEDFQQLLGKSSSEGPVSDRASAIIGSELQVYTWRDATLREIVDLVKDVCEEARQSRSSQLSLKLLHFGDRDVIVCHELGCLHSSRPGSDDRRSLLASQFNIGDSISLAIISRMQQQQQKRSVTTPTSTVKTKQSGDHQTGQEDQPNSKEKEEESNNDTDAVMKDSSVSSVSAVLQTDNNELHKDDHISRQRRSPSLDEQKQQEETTTTTRSNRSGESSRSADVAKNREQEEGDRCSGDDEKNQKDRNANEKHDDTSKDEEVL